MTGGCNLNQMKVGIVKISTAVFLIASGFGVFSIAVMSLFNPTLFLESQSSILHEILIANGLLDNGASYFLLPSGETVNIVDWLGLSTLGPVSLLIVMSVASAVLFSISSLGWREEEDLFDYLVLGVVSGFLLALAAAAVGLVCLTIFQALGFNIHWRISTGAGEVVSLVYNPMPIIFNHSEDILSAGKVGLFLLLAWIVSRIICSVGKYEVKRAERERVHALRKSLATQYSRDYLEHFYKIR